MSLSEDWNPTAVTLGYTDTDHMLRDLYVEQNKSITEISTMLGFSKGAIRVRLGKAGVDVRGRGGPNRSGMSKFNDISDEELFKSTVLDLVNKLGVAPTTISKIRRQRRDILLRLSELAERAEVGGEVAESSGTGTPDVEGFGVRESVHGSEGGDAFQHDAGLLGSREADDLDDGLSESDALEPGV